MAAMVSFGDRLAFVEAGQWIAGDARLASLCQEASDLVATSCGGWAPDRDNWLAAQVAEVLGGQLRACNGADETEERKGIVY